MKQKATLILIEHSTAGNPPKTFMDQMVDIGQVDDVVDMGADGKISPGKRPSTVKWFGGTAVDLEHITNIQIVASDGTMLVNAEILRNFEQPHAIRDGVQFQVIL